MDLTMELDELRGYSIRSEISHPALPFKSKEEKIKHQTNIDKKNLRN